LSGNGEPGGIRTHDLLIKSQMLYRLSYGLESNRARTLGSARPGVNRAGINYSALYLRCRGMPRRSWQARQ
jgi:hypothetical protein